jgi:cation diffusion facilitator family transporter
MNTQTDSDIQSIKKLIGIVILTLLPIIAAGVVIYLVTQSMALLSMVISQGLFLFVVLFSYRSMGIIQNSTVIRFPYGTGKLENFASFLVGAVTLPACLYMIAASIMRLFHPNMKLAFGIVQILLVMLIIRALFIVWYARRIHRNTNSPLALTYYENSRGGVIFFVCAFIALLAAWILDSTGFEKPAAYIDPALALVAMVYMLIISLRQVVRNYRVLIDLPLPEEEQLDILNALSREYHSFRNVGNIYTRASGRHRFIDIELFFDPETTLENIELVRSNIETNLKVRFPNLTFHLIPLVKG